MNTTPHYVDWEIMKSNLGTAGIRTHDLRIGGRTLYH